MFACSPYNQGKCFVHNWISHLQVFFLKEFETSSVFKDWTSLDLSFTNGTWIWHFRWLSMTQVACGTHLVLAQILNSAVFFSGGISISASACWWMMMENCRPSKYVIYGTSVLTSCAYTVCTQQQRICENIIFQVVLHTSQAFFIMTVLKL